jgi:hypothetical protein
MREYVMILTTHYVLIRSPSRIRPLFLSRCGHTVSRVSVGRERDEYVPNRFSIMSTKALLIINRCKCLHAFHNSILLLLTLHHVSGPVDLFDEQSSVSQLYHFTSHCFLVLSSTFLCHLSSIHSTIQFFILRRCFFLLAHYTLLVFSIFFTHPCSAPAASNRHLPFHHSSNRREWG